jgi:hypothetical protein
MKLESKEKYLTIPRKKSIDSVSIDSEQQAQAGIVYNEGP